MGAELVEVPAVPYSDPNNYVKLSGRLAEQLAKTEKNGAIWANQFDNVANRQAHVETTGPEIWRQTDGKVDGFVCAVGTGGTLAGVGIALKAFNNAVRIALADPLGAALYSYYTTGKLKSEGSSITEGIGQGRVTKNLEGAPIDMPMKFPTKRRCRSFSICSSTKACVLAARPGSMSPAPSAWRTSWDRATRSSPSSPTTAPVIKASCSTRNSCARKICRCRHGSSAIRKSRFRSPERRGRARVITK